jgi:hypothetical protein
MAPAQFVEHLAGRARPAVDDIVHSLPDSFINVGAGSGRRFHANRIDDAFTRTLPDALAGIWCPMNEMEERVVDLLYELISVDRDEGMGLPPERGPPAQPSSAARRRSKKNPPATPG